MPLHFEGIKPEPFDASVFRQLMTEAMDGLLGNILEDFGKTVETWNTQPSFEFEFHSSDEFIEMHVFCDALRDGDRVKGAGAMGSLLGGPQPAPVNLVYYFLNHGTSVRYATMTPDFMAKTRVGWLGSTFGQGGLASVDIRRPRKGIKGRHWDEEIKKKYAKILPSRLASVLIRGSRASGHHFPRGG